VTDFATAQEPSPHGGQGPSIHDLVVRDVLARKAFGLTKYNSILQVGDGRRTLVDAYQEALDLAVYLRQELAKQGIEPTRTARAVSRAFITTALRGGLWLAAGHGLATVVTNLIGG
jgi:hypothetical protein